MDQLLRIAGAVAAVQLLLAAWREWCSARRLVAISGLDADIYAEHGCVPLQFAGSRFRAIRAAVALTGFFTVRPKTRKQVFAAWKVVGAHVGSEIDYRELRPRDHLRIMLDEGEHPTVLDRSMRRGVASFYRTVAIRDLNSPDSSQRAHCVTVRTRGNIIRASSGTGSQWLDYEVIAASPRSNHSSGRTPLADLPKDTIELVIIPADTYHQARIAATERRSAALRTWLMRRNPSPVAAAAHLLSKYTTPPAAFLVLAAFYTGSTNTSAIVAAAAIPLVIIALLFIRFGVLDALSRHLRRRTPARNQPAKTSTSGLAETRRQTIPLQYAWHSPPDIWTGATAHCMSAGRQLNGTDARSMIAHAWHQISYGLRPPTDT